ncbi:MAG: hypothetical protein FWE07_04605 [Turicibacter sp.]|nr:hypothetical protein [Turicibacter sp.]
MISIYKIQALYVKQFKNLMYNYFVLAGFIVPLGMAFLMRMVTEPSETAGLFVMMTQMSILLGGANTMCCLIAEEKEKDTLSVLMSSTVSSLDFLISNSLITSTFTMMLNVAIYFMLAPEFMSFTTYLLVTTLATIISTILGAIIGLVSKNQMTATTVASPILLLLSFIPLVFMDSPFVQNFLYFSFTEQLGLVLLGQSVTFSGILLKLANLLVLVIAFTWLYKRKGFSE